MRTSNLRLREIDDWANALNGLQVENSGESPKSAPPWMPPPAPSIWRSSAA